MIIIPQYTLLFQFVLIRVRGIGCYSSLREWIVRIDEIKIEYAEYVFVLFFIKSN